MRALIVTRLSRVTDATTSPERQLQACRALCNQRGYEVVAHAEDLDVSAGKTTPFDRPQLGDWLTNRHNEFDVIVVFRMDRIVRRLLDLADVIRWCQEHSKALVSASEAFLDLTAPFGDIVALLVAKVAEMELQAISDRNKSAAVYNITRGKFRGGMPPWGYQVEQTDDGWGYVQDPQQVRTILEVVDRVLSGEPLRAVAHGLNDRGILTPRDRFAELRGREVKGYSWAGGGLKRGLSSLTLLGYAMTDGEPVRSPDGSPVVRSEPVLTRDVFDRLQVELAGRENRKEPTKRSSGLLLQVIFCKVCGSPAYRFKGGKGRTARYRCASAQAKQTCGNNTFPLPDADQLVTEHLLDLLGDSERLERVWDSGSDHSEELAEIEAQLSDITGLIGTGPYKAGTSLRAQLDARIADLTTRYEALSAEAVRPSGWSWVGTGELFSTWWENQDVEAQNIWLRRMGVKLSYVAVSNGEPSPRVRVVEADIDLGELENYLAELKPGKGLKRELKRHK